MQQSEQFFISSKHNLNIPIWIQISVFKFLNEALWIFEAQNMLKWSSETFCPKLSNPFFKKGLACHTAKFGKNFVFVSTGLSVQTDHY